MGVFLFLNNTQKLISQSRSAFIEIEEAGTAAKHESQLTNGYSFPADITEISEAEDEDLWTESKTGVNDANSAHFLNTVFESTTKIDSGKPGKLTYNRPPLFILYCQRKSFLV